VDEIRPLLEGKAYRCEPDVGRMAETVESWLVLDFAFDELEAKKKELRVVLLDWAAKNGEETEKGGQKLAVAGHLVLREKRKASKPDEKDLRKLLEEKNIASKEVFDEVKTQVLNVSKLEFLVKTGKLAEEDVAKLYGVSWALRVFPSPALKEELEGLK
jgi:hypothetical protein